MEERFNQPVAAQASRRKAVRWLLPTVVFAAPYLFIWQGLDFTDKGMMLAYADGMFRWPDVYQSMSVVWLSGALAHAWLSVAPLPTVLALNVLFALLLNALAAVSFVSLRKRFDAASLWCAILLSQLFIIPPLQNGYGYQLLSVVCLSCAAYALVNGLVEKRDGWVFASGVLVGIAVFARLPNVLGFALVALPWFHALYYQERTDWSAVFRFTVGFAVGLIAVVCLLLATDQWNVYTFGLQALFASSNDRYAAGTTSGLISTYLRDVGKMTLYTATACIVSLPMGFLLSYMLERRGNWFKLTAWRGLAALALSIVVFAFLLFPIVFILKDVQRLLLGGLIVGVALLIAFRFGTTYIRTLLWSGMIACVACFAGSDVGFGAYALFPVLLPLAAFALNREATSSLNVPTWFRVTSVFWLTVVVGVAIGLCAVYVYRDAPRAQLTFEVRNEPKLLGVFTSEARRDVVEQLLEATHRHVKPNATIWATPDLPMVYFLTSTKPFTRYPWDNLFNAQAFERRVKQYENVELPSAVITASGTTRHAYWPKEMRESTEPDRAQKEKTVTDFLSRHRYVLVWSNGFFQVWLPPQVK